MLTASQCQTVAYIGDGGFLHPDCARKRYSALAIEKADAGFSDAPVSPVIQYSLSEQNGELTWESARERFDRFADDHPELAYVLGVIPANSSWERNEATGYGRWVLPDGSQNYERALDRYAERHPVYETCDECFEPIED